MAGNSRQGEHNECEHPGLGRREQVYKASVGQAEHKVTASRGTDSPSWVVEQEFQRLSGLRLFRHHLVDAPHSETQKYGLRKV